MTMLEEKMVGLRATLEQSTAEIMVLQGALARAFSLAVVAVEQAPPSRR